MSLRLSVKHDGNQLLCESDGELGRKTQSDLSPLLILGDDLEQFLKPIIDTIRLKRPATVRSSLPRLKFLGEALVHLRVTQLPRSDSDWQSLVIAIHRFVLTRTDRKSSLQTRCSTYWQTIRGFLGALLEAGVIPVSVYLPPVRETLDSVNISAFQARLLGQSPAQVVGAAASIDKLMCSISLARTDAEYLEELRDILSHRRHVLRAVLVKHWCFIKENMEFGRKLLSSVNWHELEPRIKSYPQGEPKGHPAYPLRGLNGLANYLAVIHYEYDGCPWSDDDFRKKNRKCEFIPRQSSFGSIEQLARKLGAPKAPFGSGGWSSRNVLWWWQGRISHFDVSVLTALLIMLHPSWTPSAVMLAKVENRNGKKYLDLADGGIGFEVNKHRAKAMKHETLDPLAYDIISTLIDVNSPLRNSLLNSGDSKASLLFLPWGKRKVVEPIPSSAPSFISGKAAAAKTMVWLGSVYPELLDAGLSCGTLSFKKIRNTEGVLEWFRTKNLRAVARKLGNTEKVVLQHYIPKALLDAWNTRIIRRFQNLWLSVAAAHEEFLVDITDFESLADLHAFLHDMLKLHGSTDSPLAEMLHHRFGKIGGATSMQQFPPDGHLHVAISKGALSTLYSYQAAVIDLGLPESVLNKSDIVTGLSPRYFLSLADLLQSRLPLDKQPEYVACHEAAMHFATNPQNRLRWARLFRGHDE